MVTALVIPTAEGAPITECEVNNLEDYQAVVGGWIEPVDIPALGVTVYVHEEGLRLNLALNTRATLLWWYFVPEARQSAMLVGPALITGLPNRSGDSTDVPSEVGSMLAHPGEWRVEVRTIGDSKWYRNQTTYSDYFEALVWAMVTLERWTAAADTRVVPVLHDEVASTNVSPPSAA